MRQLAKVTVSSAVQGRAGPVKRCEVGTQPEPSWCTSSVLPLCCDVNRGWVHGDYTLVPQVPTPRKARSPLSYHSTGAAALPLLSTPLQASGGTMEAPQQQRQISPFQRTKSFSASSVANRQIVVSAPLETVISTRGSGDLAVSNNHSALLQNRSSSLTGKSLEVMDGAGDKNRGRSGSLLQTWFGGNDGGGLNEVEQAELEIERMINKIRRDLVSVSLYNYQSFRFSSQSQLRYLRVLV